MKKIFKILSKSAVPIVIAVIFNELIVGTEVFGSSFLQAFKKNMKQHAAKITLMDD